jgi:hypothetical protein
MSFTKSTFQKMKMKVPESDQVDFLDLTDFSGPLDLMDSTNNALLW